MKSSRLPLSVVAVDFGCLAFAAWTLVCNAVVLLSGTSVHLLVAGCLLLLALGSAFVAPRARGALFEFLAALYTSPATEAEREPDPSAVTRGLLVRMLAFVAGEIVLARYALSLNRGELCALALACFGLGYVALARERVPTLTPEPVRSNEWLIGALGFVCCVLSLVAHRANSDDAFYVNIAVSVADFPHQALLSRDTLHGTGAPFKIIAYRATSIELLSGLLSFATYIPASAFAHMLLPAIVAFLMPLALARLLRQLDPERFAYAVLATLLFLVFDGAARGSYGTFIFARLFQGKAMLLALGLPLVMAYGVSFGLAPSRPRFIMLAAAQIATLGLTVTAFWAAPIVATLAVASALAPRWSSLRTLLVGALSSGYLLVLGIYLQLASGSAAAALSAASGGGDEEDTVGRTTDLLAHAYSMVLGKPPRLIAAVGLVLLTWPLCRTPLARRFAIVLPLGFFATLGNPLLTRVFAAITTNEIHWRVLWLLPVPVLAGLCFSALLEPRSRRAQAYRLPLCALALGLFSQLDSRNVLARAHFDWPHLKVDEHAYRVAEALVHALPPHQRVLAPLAVSRILPMLNGYSYPLFIKQTYLAADDEERFRRKRLTLLVGRAHGHPAPDTLRDAIEDYRLDGVVIASERKHKHPLADILNAAGFHRVNELEGNQVWTRTKK